MAAPNILTSTLVNGKTAVLLITASATAILSNSSGSGKVIKINGLYISNVDASSNFTITMDLFRNSVAYRLGFNILVPLASTLDVINKPFYLEEGDSLRLSANTTGKLEAICSYEEIS
jgi:hypothetical protein